jgi:hypothetical protein
MAMKQLMATDELASAAAIPYSLAQIQKEVSVKSNLISRTLMTVTPMMIFCSGLASGSSAMAQSAAAESFDRDCSNRTLRGDYGYAAEGVLLNTPGLPPEAQFRSVGLTHFNGKGKLTWVEHTVVNGIPLEGSWTAATGTYSVNPDCTGTAVINTPNSPVPLNLFLVVVRQGTEIHTVLNSNAISTVFIKVEAHERDRDEAGGGDR